MRMIYMDMDAFFVSCEQAFKPYLKGRPISIGGSGARGVVCSCSYEARKSGVRSGMSGIAAKKLCPDIMFMPVNYNKYVNISQKIFKMLSKMLPDLKILSIDEAYADISRINAASDVIAGKIKRNLKKYFDITCSIGAGPNKLIAKMAAGVNKPDGYYFVESKNTGAFIDSFKISDIWGVGGSSVKKLAEHGIWTAEELRTAGEERLESILGVFGKRLYKAVNGIYDDSERNKNHDKSISSAITFAYDLCSKYEMYSHIERLSRKISVKLGEKRYYAQVVGVVLKNYRLEVKTFRTTLNSPIFSEEDIFKHAKRLFDEHNGGGQPVRLIGVNVSGLVTQTRYEENMLMLA